MRRYLPVFVIVSLLGCAGSDHTSHRTARQDAGVRPSPAAGDHPEAFVQEFYVWYTPLARANGDAPAWYTVLRDRPQALTPELLRALRADSLAQARAEGEIDGLDFDPFLAAQESCDRYEATSAIGRGTVEEVRVFAVCNGVRSSRPVAVADVVPVNGTWQFTNVYYPEQNSDLRSVLIELHPPAK